MMNRFVESSKILKNALKMIDISIELDIKYLILILKIGVKKREREDEWFYNNTKIHNTMYAGLLPGVAIKF